MRYWRKNIESRTTFRRKASVSHRRMVQIKGEILRQDAIVKNIVQQALIPRAKKDHMMRDTRPSALDPQMQNEKRWRPAFTPQRSGCALAAFVAGQQVIIAMHQIAVGCRHVAIHAPARLGAHTNNLVTARFDLLDRIIQPDLPAQTFKMRHHGRDQPVGSAFGKPDPAFFFNRVDQRINCTGVHRVSADQQSMEGQCLAQFFVFHI